MVRIHLLSNWRIDRVAYGACLESRWCPNRAPEGSNPSFSVRFLKKRWVLFSRHLIRSRLTAGHLPLKESTWVRPLPPELPEVNLTQMSLLFSKLPIIGM